MNTGIDSTYQTKKYSPWTNLAQYFIVHHTASNLWASDWNVMRYWYYNSSAYVSWHYTLYRDWRIFQHASHDKVCWHAGMWNVGNGLQNMNYRSIWLEIISDWYSYTDAQRRVLPEFLKHIEETTGITKDKIIRHADISWYRWKWDVWPKMYSPYSWREYIDKVFTVDLVPKEQLDLIDKYIRINWLVWDSLTHSKFTEVREDIHALTNKLRGLSD